MKYVFALVLCVLFIFSLSVQAQSVESSYSFGQAKEHAHSGFVMQSGVYCGRWLIDDESNNPGNHFFGNLVCVDQVWYWYDWSADQHAGLKFWMLNRSDSPVVTITVDHECKLVSDLYTEMCCQPVPQPTPEPEPIPIEIILWDDNYLWWVLPF